ncbi:3-deoxy-7-phosphoheptulonate synthase [Candidatus Formimonas warabiya]|uniref:3-deoxy-7-phosphoheptulonate synthase n=2 Tax=Formimonas warabiya TaxID=1761012 RepID=A0A3G1KPM0_FORW1|nr:3-deoxy-7-phosphoheptulonate synthase [Candidatus Formimonas warabiya]
MKKDRNGAQSPFVMAGPCAVESEEQLFQTAQVVKEAGGQYLRGGAFKPRTSPHSFQGLREKGLEMLGQAHRFFGLQVVTEVMDPRDVELVARYAQVLQIGSRNMQNFSLLKEVGRSGYPVLLKRGLAATAQEWLDAAEYIRVEGNERIMLCERGIRTFSDFTRNTLDLSVVPYLKQRCPYPVVVDPSHATGDRTLVIPMARAAVAAGCDGLMLEIHPDPAHALCDGDQSLNLEEFRDFMIEMGEDEERRQYRVS